MSNPNQYQPPGIPGVPSLPSMPQAAPAYAPGYQQLPPAPVGYAAPANAQGAQADVDSAGDEGSEFPKCTWGNGMPWYLTVVGCSEARSFYDGSTTFWINASVRQSPDPAFAEGMIVSVPVKKLNHPTMNNKAQARLRDFLAACCKEPKVGQAPGHFAGRKAQALSGALNGAGFAVSFTQKTAKSRNEQTGQFNTYLTPAFQQG